ncbi:hypothetical protein ACHAXR_009892 [Thalassiosira sp. AJA248-18]
MMSPNDFKLRPPGTSPCKPILLIGLPSSDDWGKYLSHILIHDLLYASTSTYMDGNANDHQAKLAKLSSLDGNELLKLTRKHKGSVILSETEVLNQQTGDVDTNRLRQLEKGDYQAVIVDDTCFIREPDITAFVMKQYAKGSSVVVMALEGIYNLSTLNQNFNVNWKVCAYTARSIKLTDIGKEVMGDAFPFDEKYVKSNFAVGEGEMFVEHQFPENYEDEEDFPDGPPPPEPGSPVVTSLGDSKSVSYFGFVNPLDVSYGAILLKLCHAQRSSDQTTMTKAQSKEGEEKKVRVPRKKLQTVPDLLSNGDDESSASESLISKLVWMGFLVVMFYISFEMYLSLRRTTTDDTGVGSKSEF